MTDKKLKINILFSSILLFGIGALLHFAYEFSNNNFLIGLITPVNESIFEHLKLAIYPIILWWVIFYLLKKDKYSLNKSSWFLGSFVSMISAIIVILSIHYFVTYGIGKELMIVSITSLYIAILIAQIIAYHIYKYSTKSNFLVSISLILILIVSFIILTIFPPKIPLFKDSKSNTYGILKSIE